MEKQNKKIVPFIILSLAVAFFYAFGIYHLAKFETVDEHFWKFERIPRYWQAIETRDLKKTYINDKPGVTVALVSGLGLFWQRHPEELRIRDKNQTQNDILTLYDWQNSEKINFSLRFPLLIFNGLFLIFFFWIIRKLSDSDWVAAWSVLFMGISPILIGISQILNPDSLLWVFSSAAIFSYFALLKTSERKFVILTAIFSGLALLSKYSANILFPIFLFILVSDFFINFDRFREKLEIKKHFLRQIIYFLLIWILSVAVFSFFMPAIFFKIKYLYQGTVGSPGFSLIFWPLLAFLAVILLDTLAFKNFIFSKIGRFFHRYQNIIFKISSALMLLIFLAILVNCWTGQKFIPFDELRDLVYQKKNSHFLSILENNNPAAEFIKEVLIQFYPFVFSQLPLILILVFALWLKIIYGKLEKFKLYIFFCTFFPLLYFPSLLFSNVLANPRYSIMIYPLFAFLGAMALVELAPHLEKFLKTGSQKIYILISLLVLFSGITALWFSKPFYFNYTNFLLPKQFLITDSWGYGEYEAAQYLNSLPESEKLLVWSDRNGICQFLKASCISGYKIDLNKTRPDYFILSKRSSIRYQFQWKYPELAKKSTAYYYQEGQVIWSLFIHNRPENFIKIIKSDEK